MSLAIRPAQGPELTRSMVVRGLRSSGAARRGQGDGGVFRWDITRFGRGKAHGAARSVRNRQDRQPWRAQTGTISAKVSLTSAGRQGGPSEVSSRNEQRSARCQERRGDGEHLRRLWSAREGCGGDRSFLVLVALEFFFFLVAPAVRGKKRGKTDSRRCFEGVEDAWFGYRRK